MAAMRPLLARLLLVAGACSSCGAHARTCPGVLQVGNYGGVSIARAKWTSPEIAGEDVELAAGGALVAHLNSRAYFADHCQEGAYDSTWYSAVRPLGYRLNYTVDLSGARCGCKATVRLVPMRQNRIAGGCKDHFCDAGGTCGETCTEIVLQDANAQFWDSAVLALGGSVLNLTSQDSRMATAAYGPQGLCIDTEKPFQVSAAFIADTQGQLMDVKIELSQLGRTCPEVASLSVPTQAATQLTKTLQDGVTPTVAYHRASGASLRGSDGGCAGEEKACAETVTFSDFVLDEVPESLANQQAASQTEPTTSTSPPTPSSTLASGPACAGGWMPAAGCAPEFSYRGHVVAGCTSEDYNLPWCSHDSLHVLGESGWSPCVPCSTSSMDAASRAEAETVTDSSPDCWFIGASYAPLDMPGREPDRGITIQECQALCLSVPDCGHFTFFLENKTCHLSDHLAMLQMPSSDGAVCGPPSCDDLLIPIRRYTAGQPISFRPYFYAAFSFTWVTLAAVASIALARCPASAGAVAHNRGSLPRSASDGAITLLAESDGEGGALTALEEAL